MMFDKEKQKGRIKRKKNRGRHKNKMIRDKNTTFKNGKKVAPDKTKKKSTKTKLDTCRAETKFYHSDTWRKRKVTKMEPRTQK